MANLLLYSNSSCIVLKTLQPIELEKEKFVKKVGANIRNIREEKKLSLERLALEAGIEYSQLSRIENGKINTSIYSTYTIANALGISVTELFIFIQ